MSYVISGVVKESSSYVSRTVRAYTSSDGLLVDETTSDATDGSFTLSCPTFEEHYVIVLDDDVAPDYNAEIISHVIPVSAS